MDFPLTAALKNDLLDRISRLSQPLFPEPTGYPSRLRSLPGIRAVVFDIYGTILLAGQGDVDAGQGQRSCAPAEAALLAAGFSSTNPCAGQHAMDLLVSEIAQEHQRSKSLGCEWPEVDIRNIWLNVTQQLVAGNFVRGRPTAESTQCLAVEYECRANPVWPMPGLRTTLETLRQKGIAFGIASNAQFYTPLVMEFFQETGWLENWFTPETCAWSYHLRTAKPGHALLQYALRALNNLHGIKPQEVLCIGNDMLNDICPAAHLTCRTALFAGDARSLRLREKDPRCEGVEPDVVLQSLNQLCEIL